jgi:hypothetical protein
MTCPNVQRLRSIIFRDVEIDNSDNCMPIHATNASVTTVYIMFGTVRYCRRLNRVASLGRKACCVFGLFVKAECEPLSTKETISIEDDDWSRFFFVPTMLVHDSGNPILNSFAPSIASKHIVEYVHIIGVYTRILCDSRTMPRCCNLKLPGHTASAEYPPQASSEVSL